jgi:hypothetical protein
VHLVPWPADGRYWVAGFKWSWLKPLAMAALLMTVLGARNFVATQITSGAKTGQVEGDAFAGDAAPISPVQVAARQGGPTASQSTTTVTGAEIESLPASSRRWEEFVMDAPPDTAQSNSAPAHLQEQRAASIRTISRSRRFRHGPTQRMRRR